MAALTNPRKSDESTLIIENKFIVPYQRNPHFVGRHRTLERIKETIGNAYVRRYNYRIALHGTGGVGKTQCALEFAYQNRANYERVYWLSAVDHSSLLSGYTKLAKQAGLVTKMYLPSGSDIAEAVVVWLNGQDNWLIVIDNLDDISVVDGLLPENGAQKHTLITTRNPYTTNIPAEPLEIKPLDSEESIDLLLMLSHISAPPRSLQRTHATRIVEELGYLPLAIKQAAAYVREVGGDLQSYLEDYSKHRKELLQWPSGNRHYPHSVASTWSLSFSVLQSNHPSALDLLRLFALLYPDKILIEFLLAGASALDPHLQQIFSSQRTIAKNLIELERFSLVKWDRPSKTISMHRLVQSVVRDEMSDRHLTLVHNAMLDLCSKAFPAESTQATQDMCRKYEDQVVQPLLRQNTIRTPDAFHLKVRVAKFLHRDGKYSDSEKLLLQALEICNEVWGSESSASLCTQYDLAWIYGEQRRLSEARIMMETVVEKRKRIYGPENTETLRAMDNLAWTYKQQRLLPEAEVMLKEVLEKQKEVLGESHVDTVRTMSNLGGTYQYQQGRLKEAAALQERVLELRKNLGLDVSPDELWAMMNLGWTYRLQGRLNEATSILELAVEKGLTNLGKRHPTTVTAMYRLGVTYLEQNHVVKSFELAQEVLEANRETLSRGHPKIISGINNLAAVYRKLDRQDEAMSLEAEALNLHHEADIIGTYR
jgi:tetratricopeptide (TPR) repeat protein